MNELLDDVIQGCRSDRSGIGEGSREGRRRGRKGIETNEARKEGRYSDNRERDERRKK